MEISRELFDQQRRPRFGTLNPERMQMAFWEWMIRGDRMPPDDDSSILGSYGLIMRGGVLKSTYGPYRARDHFQVPLIVDDGPIWTFERFGATHTALPDGRMIYVAGEHEDYYDPDFCIYNDVVVIGPNHQIDIYGYPQEVFPPTDFHTATLVGNTLILIGRLGYADARHPAQTPVYVLELAGFRISEMPTSGEPPGWICRHEARLDSPGQIIIQGGEIFEEMGGTPRFRRNMEDYALDLASGRWRRLSNRNWRQFLIRREDKGLFVLEHQPEPQAILPRAIDHRLEPSEKLNNARIVISEVPVSIAVGISAIEIIIEGNLPDALALQVVEEVRANAQVAIGCRCELEQV